MTSEQQTPLLATVSRPVSPPAMPSDPDRAGRFVETLQRCGYDMAGCAERLGAFPRLGVNFWTRMRPDWAPRSDDAVDNLIALLVDGRSVGEDALAKLTSKEFVETAVEMRLADAAGGVLTPRLSLFPCFGRYIVTDQAEKNTAINQVMWLWGESYILAGFVDRRVRRRRAIDLGTGSGVHAILASGHCSRVVGADVSPRALIFSEFNAALNGCDNVEFALSDLLNSVEGTCDLLISNVPYAPDTAAKAGDNFWSGGIEGVDLLKRVVEALPDRLDRDGTAHINALFPNPPGTRIRDHFDRWLGGRLSEWDVLDHSWPVPRYEDLFSDKPYEGDKSAWRFGVVSLRRAANRDGWWKEVGGRGLFFRSDGSCDVVADHDAY